MLLLRRLLLLLWWRLLLLLLAPHRRRPRRPRRRRQPLLVVVCIRVQAATVSRPGRAPLSVSVPVPIRILVDAGERRALPHARRRAGELRPGHRRASRSRIRGGNAHRVLTDVVDDLAALRGWHRARARDGACRLGPLLRLGALSDELRVGEVFVLFARERLGRRL